MASILALLLKSELLQATSCSMLAYVTEKQTAQQIQVMQTKEQKKG